ncbi:MAG: sensor N-terminal transmembrane domain-containing protein, partial [Boseongicola sp.]|nr:sensor N-terminal transmembrane domain-containing protein [Boseongicola sp.]
MGAKPAKHADVVLGEDWLGQDAAAESEARAKRDRRGLISMNRSPLARKIITFNLLAILVLVAGVLFLNPFRDSLVAQRERALIIEADLIAGFLDAQISAGPSANAFDNAEAIVRNLRIQESAEVFVFEADNKLVVSTVGNIEQRSAAGSQFDSERTTILTDFLNTIWSNLSGLFGKANEGPPVETTNEEAVSAVVDRALTSGTQIQSTTDIFGNTIFTVATPIRNGGDVVGAVAIA